MNLWFTLMAAGLLTYAIRLSFILMFEKIRMPGLVRRALRLVPPAVLSAIIFPELLLRGGSLDLSTGNTRLLAGLLAALVAWRTRNALLTIAIGMASLLVLQTLLK
jgi:branched-subunit amino acid transport protein